LAHVTGTLAARLHEFAVIIYDFLSMHHIRSALKCFSLQNYVHNKNREERRRLHQPTLPNKLMKRKATAWNRYSSGYLSNQGKLAT